MEKFIKAVVKSVFAVKLSLLSFSLIAFTVIFCRAIF